MAREEKFKRNFLFPLTSFLHWLHCVSALCADKTSHCIDTCLIIKTSVSLESIRQLLKNNIPESACQCRGHGLNPCTRNVPHATGQLSPCLTTEALITLEPMIYNTNEKQPQWEAYTLQLKSSPGSSWLEKAHMQQWRPSTVKHFKK